MVAQTPKSNNLKKKMHQFEKYVQEKQEPFWLMPIWFLFQTNQEMQSNNVMFQKLNFIPVLAFSKTIIQYLMFMYTTTS